MSKESVTTQEIQDAVFRRITSQQYSAGERLPSVRDLAKELGANRNTVNRAYQMLTDLGLVEMSPGRKGFVVKSQLAKTSRAALEKYFFSQARQLIWQGFASGLSHEEVSGQLSKALEEVYKLGTLKIAFFECNRQDSQEMGHFLSQMLQRDIDSKLLDELTTDSEQSYDLIITTFHHLSSLMQILKHHNNRVVGVDTRLSPETLLEIARLPRGRLGIVCTLPSTAQMLQHILYSYYPEREIKAVTTDDKAAIKHLAKYCDYLLVTHTCAEEVTALSQRKADIVIHFQIDQQSIQFLDKRIHTLQLEKTQAVRKPGPNILTRPVSAN